MIVNYRKFISSGLFLRRKIEILLMHSSPNALSSKEIAFKLRKTAEVERIESLLKAIAKEDKNFVKQGKKYKWKKD